MVPVNMKKVTTSTERWTEISLTIDQFSEKYFNIKLFSKVLKHLSYFFCWRMMSEVEIEKREWKTTSIETKFFDLVKTKKNPWRFLKVLFSFSFNDSCFFDSSFFLSVISKQKLRRQTSKNFLNAFSVEIKRSKRRSLNIYERHKNLLRMLN